MKVFSLIGFKFYVKENYVLYFFRFPGIRLGFILHKLKWQQSVVTAVAVPSSIVFYYCGMIDSSWTIGVILSGKF